MDLGIEGRAALVVAGSRGLGRATAEALAAEGVRVMVSSRSEAALADSRRPPCGPPGAEVATQAADITDPDAPARLVAATVEAFGTVDIVVANAGGPPPGRALEVDDALLERGAQRQPAVRRPADPGSRAAPCADRGWGRICCITSYSVVQPIPALALSNTARAGLWAWAKTAAQDLAAEGTGITLNLALPRCPMPPIACASWAGPGAMGDPADFGSLVAFLCSEQAAFVNGAALVVDGGATLAL